jgi:hypothetical protein
VAWQSGGPVFMISLNPLTNSTAVARHHPDAPYAEFKVDLDGDAVMTCLQDHR